MKKLLTICSLFCAGMLPAQTINNTYYHPILHDAGNVAVLEEGNDIIFSSYNDRLILNRTDAFGNHINSITFGDQRVVKHDIVRCRNEKGVVAVYRYYFVPDQIFISHFDDQLNPIWHINMPVNARTHINPGTSSYWDLLENVDIIEHKGLFYITYSEGSPLPGLDYESTVSVMCIDDVGNLQWYRNYADPTRVAGLPQRDDLANSITLCDYSGQEALTIGGTVQENHSSALFFMTLDLNGNILNNFTHIRHVGGETRPDVAYDANNDYIVCTYAAGGASSNPNINSSIGLLRLRMQGLSWVDGCIYDVALGYQDIGEGITVDANGNYVISASVITGTPPNAIPNVYLLSINSNTLYSYGGAATYNINVSKVYVNAQHAVDDKGNIYFATTLNSTQQNTRLFKTDPSFVACGDIHTGFEPTFYNTTPHYLQYSLWNPHMPQFFGINVDPIDITFDRCEESGDHDQYRKVLTAATTATTITLMPTLLQSADELHCMINMEVDGMVEVYITNMSGQREYNSRHQLQAGKETISIKADLPTGMHVVRVFVNGKLQHTQKVNVIN